MLSHAFLLYLSAIFTGIERGGIPGLAPVAVTTLLATSGSAGLGRRLLGVMIPAYFCSDLTACYLYRESIRWDILRELVLPIAVGMFFSFLSKYFIFILFDSQQLIKKFQTSNELTSHSLSL
jgi:hypothetical protein